MEQPRRTTADSPPPINSTHSNPISPQFSPPLVSPNKNGGSILKTLKIFSLKPLSTLASGTGVTAHTSPVVGPYYESATDYTRTAKIPIAVTVATSANTALDPNIDTPASTTTASTAAKSPATATILSTNPPLARPHPQQYQGFQLHPFWRFPYSSTTPGKAYNSIACCQFIAPSAISHPRLET